MALLGDAIQIRKNNLINIKDDTDYLIAGIQNYGKGVVIRRTVKGSELTMKKYQIIDENQLMWCKVDTKNGAFGVTKKEHIGALASTNMCLADIKKEKYLPVFIETLFAINPFHEWITKYSLGSTNRKYLTPIQLIERVEIPDLSIEQQKNFLLKVSALNESGLVIENQNQFAYLTKLRQAILQEAIEGKLTADWRKENPVRKGDPDFDAEALLEKIQAEKEKLIKEGKIKKQKPLAQIKAEEVPFDLPEGWVWTRLGEVSQVFAGYSFNSYDFKTKNGAKCIKITNAGVQQLIESEERLPSDYVTQYKDFLVKTNDLIIALTRPYISNGLKISRCPESFNNALLNQRVAAIRNYFSLNWNYIFQFMTSDFVLNGYKDKFEKVNLQPNLKMSDVTELHVPLPPLAEQHVIVDRIEKLLSMVDELEKQVSERKEQSEQLIQAVLREAFEGGK